MADIIRPRFGGKATRGSSDDKHHGPVEFIRGYGEAAGYHVGLIRDAQAPEGDVYRVVVRRIGSPSVEAVAVTPVTPIGENDAGMIAMAVLRTLEVTEGS